MPASSTHGTADRALTWYRQFREIVLMFALINIESLCEPPITVILYLFNRVVYSDKQSLRCTST